MSSDRPIIHNPKRDRPIIPLAKTRSPNLLTKTRSPNHSPEMQPPFNFILKNPLPITYVFGYVVFIVGQIEIEDF